jgi:hypothetical protein
VLLGASKKTLPLLDKKFEKIWAKKSPAEMTGDLIRKKFL